MCQRKIAEGDKVVTRLTSYGKHEGDLETGPAVVGDVGIRSKLDYTAHGDAWRSCSSTGHVLVRV